MKTVLAVTILKSGLGSFTNKVILDSNYPLSVELNNTLKYLVSLYAHLGDIDKVLLIEHNEVYAIWNGIAWYDDNGNLKARFRR